MLSAHTRSQTREVEALVQLYSLVSPSEPMPPSGVWAMSPQGLLQLVSLVRQHRPSTVVELGSGTSTAWLAYALATHGGSKVDSRLLSLDHDQDYAAQTRVALEPHLTEIGTVDVRHAPLRPLDIGDERFDWYGPEALADVDQIDMLVVDGPPGATNPLARYPAVPVLHDRLADGAVVVLDDASRQDEQSIVKRWLAELPGLARQPSSVSRLAVMRYMRAD